MATADALLFELLELLALSFPKAAKEATLSFSSSDDGARYALTDLNAMPRGTAVERPALGYTDEEILDGLNACLSEFLVDRLGESVGATSGALRLSRTDEDRAPIRAALTVDGKGTVWERVVDVSEQHHLVHTDALFRRLKDTEADERALRERSSTFVGKGAKYGFDPHGARFNLVVNGEEQHLRADAIATFHQDTGSFFWAWANDPLPKSLRTVVDQVRRSATEPGLAAFAREELTVPPLMAQRLSDHAAVKLGASFVFHAPLDGPGGKLILILALSPLSSDEAVVVH